MLVRRLYAFRFISFHFLSFSPKAERRDVIRRRTEEEEQEEESKEEEEDNEAAHDAATLKAREWDNWKDDHEKGIGNRMK